MDIRMYETFIKHLFQELGMNIFVWIVVPQVLLGLWSLFLQSAVRKRAKTTYPRHVDESTASDFWNEKRTRQMQIQG